MSHRILYVDDEPDMQDIVSLSLGREPSFDVRSCGSGREALGIAAEWQPDLILLDVVMPDLDGPTTLVRLREIPAVRSVPVVFVTARSQPAEVVRLRALGASGVIGKPFSPKALVESVKTYLVPSADPGP
jgi:CheY-like chemotaxis protein